jgi:regulator of sigma E protease
MSIVLFIIILAALVFVHELGHFLAAKSGGIRVDEFGLGFPPRAIGKKIGETIYSLNWIPFGGFVKIFGENPDEESIDGPDKARSFVHKNPFIKIWVLVAGVSFNIIFAWILFTIGFASGFPAPVGYVEGANVKDAALTITQVLPNSPAQKAGLETGDRIVSLNRKGETLNSPTVIEAQNFIAEEGAGPFTALVTRGSDAPRSISITPETGLIENKVAIGVSMDTVGILQLPIHRAAWEAAKTTGAILKAVTVGLFTFIKDAFTGHSDFGQVTGPIGIVGLVGSASQLGWVYVLSFTAFISLNLAVINILPFPALDGGRVLFIIIESIKGRQIKPSIANTVNSVGFVLLLILMAVVTLHDVIKLF